MRTGLNCGLALFLLIILATPVGVSFGDNCDADCPDNGCFVGITGCPSTGMLCNDNVGGTVCTPAGALGCHCRQLSRICQCCNN